MPEQINFAGITGEYADLETAKIVIIPVPFDLTSQWTRSWSRSSERGPQAIIEASQFMELYDIETKTLTYENIIHTSAPITARSSKELVENVEAKVEELIKLGKFVVVLGGEHTVSIGAIWAHKEKKEDLTVVQLDAHTDLRDDYEGDKFSHACVMARAKEIAPIVQIGIRSLDNSELINMPKDGVFYAKDIYNRDDWMDNAINKMKKKVYVTIDLDVFDNGAMPSVGTPEPGGLDWYRILGFLKKLSEKREIVGFDVVELAPNPSNKAPDFLAAKLTYTFLSYIFAEKNKHAKKKGLF
jgi:agmatinase